jgi:hypothetical protein
MVEIYGKTTDEQRRSVANSTGTDNHEFSIRDNSLGDLSRAAGLVSNSKSSARPNAASRAATLHSLQRTYGNRAVQRRLQSAGRQATTAAAPISVQRSSIWDSAKKMLSVDQIGSAVGKVVDKTTSGVETAQDKILEYLALGLGGKAGGQDLAPAIGGPRIDYFPHFESVEGEYTDDGIYGLPRINTFNCPGY